LGVSAGLLSGLSAGGAARVGVLSASASYIAAPTAVRLALPEASPGIYLTASLGLTFPFNLVAGIPLYMWLSTALEGVLSWTS
ncbi:MAG: sodium-dependent bicarbonate transport family permease, partial [Pontimonas sp.]